MKDKRTEETLEEQYEEYREKIREFTLMDDIFIRNVLKDQTCTEVILQIVLKQKELRVKGQVIQKDYKNLQGRSAVLDCVAETTDGRLLNIEIQQEKEGASPKRARYYSGLLDMNKLRPGQDFDELPESYVIMITRGDILGYAQPIYYVSRMIHGQNVSFAPFPDDSHIIYVDVDKTNETTELGKLMHDFWCKKASDMYHPVLAKRVRELKETEEGIKEMCSAMDGMMDRAYNRGIEQGVERGKTELAKELIFSWLKEGSSIEAVAHLLNVDVAQVRKWIEEESFQPVG